MIRIYLLTLSIFLCSAGMCQSGDQIIGKWMKMPKEDLIMEVYKSGNKYEARIKWTKTPDAKKPIGYVLMNSLQYDSTNRSWEDGIIYVPNSEKTYKAFAEIRADGQLKLLGYMGMKMLGKTKYFKKIVE